MATFESGIVAFDPMLHVQPDFSVDGKAYVCMTRDAAKIADRRFRHLKGFSVCSDVIAAFESRQKIERRGAR